MKKYGAVILLALVSGCGSMGTPMNRPAFVSLVSGGMFLTEKSTQEVNRPFAAVVASINANVGRCLSGQVNWTGPTGDYGGRSSGTTTYNPGFKISEDRKSAGLTVQILPYPKPLNDIPEKGIYYFAADITAKDARTTSIVYYRNKPQTSLILKAVRAWAEGSGNECPDLTKK